MKLPLIAGFAPDAVFAWREGEPIPTRRFLRDVARLGALLPARGQVLNLCADRYRFAVGFGAALLRGQVSLLPPNHTPEMVAQLLLDYPGLYCLREEGGPALEIETLLFPQEAGAADGGEPGDPQAPLIPEEQVAAIVFTSGSTGTPLPNRKTWGRLTLSAQSEAARLGLRASPGEPAWSLVGTVPPQHMYGFESTVLLPMQGGLAMHAGRPFYAADVAAALGSLPHPRALITTPVHLRALVEEAAASASSAAAFQALPDFLLCATAPLSDDLARSAEARLKAPLYEIYGCTEAGQVATRRSSAGPRWQALPGLELHQDQLGTWVRGGHVEGEVLLGDVIELADDTHFELRGRNADMINIAGKRTSLAHLNFQLGNIEGVRDGVFVLPEHANKGEAEKNPEVVRLAALVVAPGLKPAQITAALRRRVDAVFLPRPLYMVEALPRNSTGKLTAAALRELLAQCATKPPTRT